jgi:ABC-2 type transport system permease protein
MTGWQTEVFSLEIKRYLTYRVDFWIQLLTPVFSQLVIAYFLWSAVFESQNASTLGGMTFQGVLLYYLLVALWDKVSNGSSWKDGITVDIYQGALTRYLVYPISYLGYRMSILAATICFGLCQFAIGVAIFKTFFDSSQLLVLSVDRIAWALLFALISGPLIYLMGACLELVSFWADNVWSLQVMLRFAFQLLGGSLLPLAMYPDWAKEVLVWTPFPIAYSLPIRAMMGTATTFECVQGACVGIGWIVIFFLLFHFVFRRGLRVYSGVGL